MNRRYFHIYVFIVFVINVSFSYGQGNYVPKVRHWDSNLIQSSGTTIDQIGTRATALVFDNLLNQKISFGEEKKRGRIEVKRAVFDNQDIAQTWTIIDQLSFSMTSSLTLPLLTYPVASLNLKLGAGSKIEIQNYQMIQSKDYKTYPTLEDLALDAEEKKINLLNNDLYFDYDPSIRSRISHITNPFLQAFKVPLSLKSYGKLKKGELISYSASGHIMVGLNAGIIPFKVKDKLNFNIFSFDALAEGVFRITVFKENSRFAKVKVTKMKQLERKWELGFGGSKPEVHKGFILFKDRKHEIDTKAIKITVVPFKFNSSTQNIKSFDVGYRFDLKSIHGREAYLKAVRGNFSYAEEMAFLNQGVTHLLTRESRERRKKSFRTLGIDIFAKNQSSKDLREVEISLNDEKGFREIFKSSYELSQKWSSVWGRRENKKFLFTTLFNKTQFFNKKSNYFNLLFEGLIEDNHTRSSEMEDYLRQVKLVIGEKKLLPNFEELVIDPNPYENSNERIDLKRNFSSSTFYFGQSLSHQQILKFINTPNGKAWNISQKAFQYIIDKPQRERMISQFYTHWMSIKSSFRQIQNAEDAINILKDLRRLFKKHTKAIYALTTINFALDGEETDYFLTATNKSFGRIQLRGKKVNNIEKMIQEADQAFKFVAPIVQFSTDPELIVQKFQIKQISSDAVEIKLTIPKNTKYLFFKIYRHNSVRAKILEELVFINDGRFKAGENTWVISRNSSDELEKAFFDAFNKNDYYTIQTSLSQDKTKWGRLATGVFFYSQPDNDDQ